jgi:hypothetical protein
MLTKRERRRQMSSRFDELLTDQQLENATTDEIDDLVERIDKVLQSRGEPGIVRRQRSSDGLPEPSDPADPNAP